MKARTFLAMVGGLLAHSQGWADLPSVGPDYRRPEVPQPAAFKTQWKVASPRSLDAGAWWQGFGDSTLNGLISRLDASNPTLEAALARIEQARAASRVARSEFLPSLSTGFSAGRQKTSANLAVPFPLGRSYRGNDFMVPLDFSYEIDVWGRVRRQSEAARAEVQAAEAAEGTARLALRAELASTYFALRALDTQREVVGSTLGLRQEALKLARQRLDAGTGNDFDVARDEAELANTQDTAGALAQQRPALENALAVLIGVPASEFRLSDQKWSGAPKVPAFPAGVPSELLERRPDVAAAEASVHAATARIGVAKAAYFPKVQLRAQGGLQSGEPDSIVDKDSEFWNVGLNIRIPLFDNVRNRALVDAATAAAVAATADYRRSVLTAFSEVETALGALKALQDRSAAVDRAVASTGRAAKLARSRFDAGSASYLEVIEAERGNLGTQLTRAQIQGQRLSATIQLVKALGGGWSGISSPETAAPVKSGK